MPRLGGLSKKRKGSRLAAAIGATESLHGTFEGNGKPYDKPDSGGQDRENEMQPCGGKLTDEL